MSDDKNIKPEHTDDYPEGHPCRDCDDPACEWCYSQDDESEASDDAQISP
jgi:hypothetical protein